MSIVRFVSRLTLAELRFANFVLGLAVIERAGGYALRYLLEVWVIFATGILPPVA